MTCTSKNVRRGDRFIVDIADRDDGNWSSDLIHGDVWVATGMSYTTSVYEFHNERTGRIRMWSIHATSALRRAS